MRVQKFNSRHFKSILESPVAPKQSLLFDARDNFITSEDKAVTSEVVYGTGSNERIIIEDKDDHVVVTHKVNTGLNRTQRTNIFILRDRSIERTSTLIQYIETTI